MNFIQIPVHLYASPNIFHATKSETALASLSDDQSTTLAMVLPHMQILDLLDVPSTSKLKN